MMFAGVQVIFSDDALETTSERLFPASKHRSRRIHKRLVKRFGGEFRKIPAIFKAGNKIIMHPAHKERFLAEIARQNLEQSNV